MAFKINATLQTQTGLIAEGLYCAEVESEPIEKEGKEGRDQLEWTFKLVMAEPGNEAEVGRTLKHWTNNYIGTDKNTGEPKDFTWPSSNVVRALGVAVKPGQMNTISVPLARKKCGVVIAHKPRYSDGRIQANIDSVMDLKTFQKEMAQRRNEAEYVSSLAAPATDDYASGDAVDVSSDEL